MARVAMCRRYVFEHPCDQATAVAWRSALSQSDGGDGVGLQATVATNVSSARVSLELWAEQEAEDAWTAVGAVKEIDGRLETTFSDHVRHLRFGRHSQSPGDAHERLGELLSELTPQVELRLPTRTEHHGLIVGDASAEHLVRLAVEERSPLWPDRVERLAGLQVRAAKDELVITVASPKLGVDVGSAYFQARVGRPPLKGPAAATPIWAWASALVVLWTFGMSFLWISPATIAVLGAGVLVLVLAAVILAPRWLASRLTTALGLLPIVILVTFACVYASVSISDHALVHLSTAATPMHLRDVLLLSLSLMSTVGLFDLQLSQWVRSLAYLEMLLVASLAGGAILVAARRSSRLLHDVVEELRLERGG